MEDSISELWIQMFHNLTTFPSFEAYKWAASVVDSRGLRFQG
jgi:hypothetical protein